MTHKGNIADLLRSADSEYEVTMIVFVTSLRSVDASRT